MKIIKTFLTVVGLFVTALWLAGAVGIGHFKLSYGPPKSADETLACIEFPDTDALFVFRQFGVVRAGTQVSVKSNPDCKGLLQRSVVIK